MSDPILLFLTIDVVALLLLGGLAAVMPAAVSGFIATALCGLGALLCLPPLVLRLQATALALPVGPPGLSLHLGLDPLATVFLVSVFLSGTAVAAFQAMTVPLTKVASVRVTTFCVAGTAFSVMAADGVALSIGLAVSSAAIWRDRRWPRAAERCWTRNALTAGAILPMTIYLLLRLAGDLPGSAGQAWWGFILLLAGGLVAVVQGWRSAAHADIDTAVAALVRRQGGVAMTGVGLALVARAADLPGAASLALEAVFLTAIGGSIAGMLASLASDAIGASAGTYRLSRLGGLVHLMPGTSAALACGILALSALPPGAGFASLWLLFQSILSAPRTGGLLPQMTLALSAAALALSAALGTTASVRLIGIALLGRPRTPRGSGARESKSPLRTILLTLAGVSLLVGAIPGPAVRLMADPAIRALLGVPPGRSAVLPVSATSAGYSALPVVALLALATGAVLLASRRSRRDSKPLGIWADGMAPPTGLPFGEPAAQSAGAGFLPTLPSIAFPTPPLATIAWGRVSHLLSGIVPEQAGTSQPADPAVPAPRRFGIVRRPSAVAGIWLLIAGFGALLLALAVTG